MIPVDAAIDQVAGCRVAGAGNGHDTQGYVTAPSILQQSLAFPPLLFLFVCLDKKLITAAALFPSVFTELLAPYDLHSKYFQCTYYKLLPPLCICAFYYLQLAWPEAILGAPTTLFFLSFTSSLYIFLLINLRNNDYLFDFSKTEMQLCARTVTLVLLLTSLSHSG